MNRIAVRRWGNTERVDPDKATDWSITINGSFVGPLGQKAKMERVAKWLEDSLRDVLSAIHIEEPLFKREKPEGEQSA